MGVGSGGIWIGVTFDTLERWPGQEYLCMSRVFAAYSVGGLIGPALGVVRRHPRPIPRLPRAAGCSRCRSCCSSPSPRSGASSPPTGPRFARGLLDRLRGDPVRRRSRSACSRAFCRCTSPSGSARPRSARSTWARPWWSLSARLPAAACGHGRSSSRRSCLPWPGITLAGHGGERAALAGCAAPRRGRDRPRQHRLARPAGRGGACRADRDGDGRLVADRASSATCSARSSAGWSPRARLRLPLAWSQPPPRSCTRSHSPAGEARVSEIQLNDPQTLYRHWEESQWSPFEDRPPRGPGAVAGDRPRP